MTSSESATSTIASSSSSVGTGTSGGESGTGYQVPLTHDSLTFGARQEVRLKEMEKKVDEELRKKRRDWNRDVARMREEVIQLLPLERSKDSDETTLEPFIARRRGSTDCLDVRKMKTLFLEYPDGGRRCKLRFDVSGFDDDEIAVTTDGERIIVRATTTPSGDDGASREYVRKIEKPKEVDHTKEVDHATPKEVDHTTPKKVDHTTPKEVDYTTPKEVDHTTSQEVDHTKLKSTLTTDGILVVEASMPPVTLNLKKSSGPGSSSPASSTRSSANHNGGGGGGGSTASLPRSKSSSRAGSPAPPAPSICPRELLGVPVIRDLDGRRRLSLVVDLGTTFTPKEISIFLIKESRLKVRLPRFIRCWSEDNGINT